MKIRSSLTERTLYRQRTDKSTARSNGRRLTTLTLALVLVLLLMQQAGDPEVYRKIFARLGVPITTPAGIEIPSQPDFLPVAATETDSAADVAELIAQLNAEDRERLTRRLAAIRHRDPAAMAEPDESQNALAATVASAARESGFADPTRYDAALLDADAADPELERFRLELQSALDATYFDTIEDGTVWNQADFKAFYRSLERIAANDRLSDDPVYVGVVPLIEQSISYRGRHVRMYGQAVQASRIDAKPNPFQIDHYWMVWLRPIDGSERPIVVYSPSVPPQIAALKSTGVDESGPMVDVDGIFLKRYLYRSVGGYDQAPLLVARIETARQTAATGNKPPPRSRVAIAVAAAAMIAAAATGLWYWSFRRSQRRDHLLRQKRTQPDLKLFDELD